MGALTAALWAVSLESMLVDDSAVMKAEKLVYGSVVHWVSMKVADSVVLMVVQWAPRTAVSMAA
jgi:hypothetical protein